MECSSAGFDIPPSRLENPALQNAESEWNSENAIFSSVAIGSVSGNERKNATAPNASMARVNPRMRSSVGIRLLMVLE